jgi:hypothetical protein
MKTIFLKLYKIGSALWRIRDFMPDSGSDFYLSPNRIPYPKTATKESGEK